MTKLEPVMVVLGVAKDETGPMPATITRIGRPSNAEYRYLTAEQLDAMGGDQTAYWHAERVDGKWWLKDRLPNKVSTEDAKAWRKPVQLDEAEIPF